MRKLIFILLFSLNAILITGQTITNPYIQSQNEYSLKIEKIELSSTGTIIYCTHTASDNYKNGGWVRLEPGIKIRESNGTRTFKLIRAEGIPLAPNKYTYSYSGQKLSFRMFFPRIPSDISDIDIIECDTYENCFNFYGVRIRNVYSNKNPSEERAGRKFLRDKINEWGECKNVAMTLTGGDVALYQSNGWAADGAPTQMTDKLGELNESNQLIDDIVLTEEGNWLILWGNNGISSYGTPPGLYPKLKKWNEENEVITSVTFNDKGDWIAITKTKYSASSNVILDYIKEGEEKNGEFWAAHLTNDGMVLCYERGYQFLGNVPEILKSKLRETKINVFRIKFLSDGSYFIADFKGNYAYNM